MIELINNTEDGNSIIRYCKQFKSTDEDDDLNADHIVPFQVAYAISIHRHKV